MIKNCVGIIMLMSMLSCGNQSAQLFVQPTALQAVQSIAVLPLTNLTDDPHAAAVMQELLAAELFRTGKFRLLAADEMRRQLSDKNITFPASWDRFSAARAAQALQVDAIIYGSVLEYTYLREIRDGAVVAREPAVGLQLRMVDAKNGQLIWAASHARSSYDVVVSNRDSISLVAGKAIEKLVATLSKSSRP